MSGSLGARLSVCVWGGGGHVWSQQLVGTVGTECLAVCSCLLRFQEADAVSWAAGLNGAMALQLAPSLVLSGHPPLEGMQRKHSSKFVGEYD